MSDQSISFLVFMEQEHSSPKSDDSSSCYTADSDKAALESSALHRDPSPPASNMEHGSVKRRPLLVSDLGDDEKKLMEELAKKGEADVDTAGHSRTGASKSRTLSKIERRHLGQSDEAAWTHALESLQGEKASGSASLSTVAIAWSRMSHRVLQRAMRRSVHLTKMRVVVTPRRVRNPASC